MKTTGNISLFSGRVTECVHFQTGLNDFENGYSVSYFKTSAACTETENLYFGIDSEVSTGRTGQALADRS